MTPAIPAAPQRPRWDEMPMRWGVNPIALGVRTRVGYYAWLRGLLPDLVWRPRTKLPHRIGPRGARKLTRRR